MVVTIVFVYSSSCTTVMMNVVVVYPFCPPPFAWRRELISLVNVLTSVVGISNYVEITCLYPSSRTDCDADIVYVDGSN